MISDAEVVEALAGAFTRMTPSQGYLSIILPDKVRMNYDAAFIEDTQDSSYPKLLFVRTGATPRKLTANQLMKTVRVTLLFIDRDTQGIAATQKTEAFIKDLVRLCAMDSQLGGAAQDWSIETYDTDGGVTAPEGIVNARIEVVVFGEPSV